MKQEAEANAEADRLEKERVEKLNMADALIFQTEKQIKEFADKLTETNKSDLNVALDKLKSAHKDQKMNEIDSAMTNLNDTWSKISTELYSQSSQPTSEPVNTEEGNTQDVQFEEVKD
jgi:molecular chaperone DnaK